MGNKVRTFTPEPYTKELLYKMKRLDNKAKRANEKLMEIWDELLYDGKKRTIGEFLNEVRTTYNNFCNSISADKTT